MTWINFWKDLWLDIRYGRWCVERKPVRGSYVFDYYAVCRRSKDVILCTSKREAEGVAAINNDSRGQGYKDVRLP